MTLLDNMTAIITGGSQGIGRAIALSLATHGADIVVADIQRKPQDSNRCPITEVIEKETKSLATYVKCDVTKPDHLVKACDVAEEYGGVDVMVNNAGIVRDVKFLESTEKDFNSIMNVNLKGVYFGCQAAAERMLENDGGSIINISSAAADQGFGDSGGALYCASKGGVKSMTYALAEILGPSIRVNVLQPGFTEDTGLATLADDEMKRKRGQEPALGRLAKPQDIGEAVVLLASDLSSYISGESLLVDGGWVNTRGSYQNDQIN